MTGFFRVTDFFIGNYHFYNLIRNLNKSNMKSQVIEFLQNLSEAPQEQFNKAFELYRQSEGKNLGAERAMNATGYSPNGLANLLYDLQKLHGISDTEKHKVIKLVPKAEVRTETEEEDETEEKAEAETKANPNTESINTEALNTEVTEDNEVSEGLKEIPIDFAEPIRVEFPFLNEKDCPDELKILVADKITAWNSYLTFRKEIAAAESGEKPQTNEILAIMANEAIKCFDENQKIYDELNVYATTGKILGVHPIFKKLQLLREVETMTADELIKYKNSSAKYFSVNKTALAKADKEKDTVKVDEITSRVADRNDKLFLVNKKLGV